MAGYGLQLAKAINEGSLVGPSIYSSNCIIRWVARNLPLNCQLNALQPYRRTCRCP